MTTFGDNRSIYDLSQNDEAVMGLREVSHVLDQPGSTQPAPHGVYGVQVWTQGCNEGSTLESLSLCDAQLLTQGRRMNAQRMTSCGSTALPERCQTRWCAQPADVPSFIARTRWPSNSAVFPSETCWCNEGCLTVFPFTDGALQARLASLQLETKNVRIASSHNGGVWKEDWSWWAKQSLNNRKQKKKSGTAKWFSGIIFTGDMSSISGSDSDSEEDSSDSDRGGTSSNITGTDNESATETSFTTGRLSSKVVFQNAAGQYLSVYRCVLQGKVRLDRLRTWKHSM